MADNREGYEEINTLVGTIAKALDLPEDQVTREIEEAVITLHMGEDDSGNRFIDVRRGDAGVKVYKGAVRHAPGAGPDA